MKLKTILNPNREIVRQIDKGLEENKNKYGKRYCPCSLLREDKMICPCEEFRNQTATGFCHCQKFQKILVDDNT